MNFFDYVSTANPVFYRTYSRLVDGKKESWEQVCERTVEAISELGRFNEEEKELVKFNQVSCRTFPSGRWLWVGGSEWLDEPENYPGAFNCSSTNLDSIDAFGSVMELAAMGCGTGVILEPWCIEKLPKIKNKLIVEVTPLERVGIIYEKGKYEDTGVYFDEDEDRNVIIVGDSRQGWVSAYQKLIEIATEEYIGKEPGEAVKLYIDLTHVSRQENPSKDLGELRIR